MVKVDPEMLRDHASRLQSGPGAQLSTAYDAAAQVGLGDESAYGIIFAQVIPPVLDNFLDDETETLKSIGDLASGYAQAVQDTADQYQDADDEVAALFDALLKELK